MKELLEDIYYLPSRGSKEMMRAAYRFQDVIRNFRFGQGKFFE